MILPLILLICILVIYPVFYAIHLVTLNKGMTKFVGFGNFQFLFKRDTFWMVVEQSCLFAVTAVVVPRPAYAQPASLTASPRLGRVRREGGVSGPQ